MATEFNVADPQTDYSPTSKSGPYSLNISTNGVMEKGSDVVSNDSPASHLPCDRFQTEELISPISELAEIRPPNYDQSRHTPDVSSTNSPSDTTQDQDLQSSEREN